MSDDLISRQSAIDALDGEITITGRANAEAVRGYANLVSDRIKRLPSAQPEIIRCKDCIWWRDEYCTNPIGMFLPEEDSFCSCSTERRTDG